MHMFLRKQSLAYSLTLRKETYSAETSVELKRMTQLYDQVYCSKHSVRYESQESKRSPEKCTLGFDALHSGRKL
jgi:hypothetical protein